MKKNAVPPRRMVFVCSNHREGSDRPSCNGPGAALREKLKELVKARGLNARIRVGQSGCLDQCKHGPNIMVFPDNLWYSGVAEGDLDAILNELAALVEAPNTP